MPGSKCPAGAQLQVPFTSAAASTRTLPTGSFYFWWNKMTEGQLSSPSPHPCLPDTICFTLFSLFLLLSSKEGPALSACCQAQWWTIRKKYKGKEDAKIGQRQRTEGILQGEGKNKKNLEERRERSRSTWRQWMGEKISKTLRYFEKRWYSFPSCYWDIPAETLSYCDTWFVPLCSFTLTLSRSAPWACQCVSVAQVGGEGARDGETLHYHAVPGLHHHSSIRTASHRGRDPRERVPRADVSNPRAVRLTPSSPCLSYQSRFYSL